MRAIAIIAVLLVLSACTVQPRGYGGGNGAGPTPGGSDSDGGMPRTVAFDCEGHGGLTARYQDGAVRLFLPGRSIVLPAAVSASGARYAGPAGTFWEKGGDARLTLDGRVRRCVALDALDPWAEAKLSGVSFRALGHAPEWLLEIRPSGGAILRQGRQGRQGVPPDMARWPWEAPRHSATARIWTLSARHGALTVFSTPRPCRDARSGEAFPETVTVISPFGTVQGCGRDLE